jgi:hypothetical protein
MVDSNAVALIAMHALALNKHGMIAVALIAVL